MEQQKKNNKKLIAALVALVAVLAIFAVVFFVFKPKATAGSKEITVTVVDNNGAETVYESNTDQQYLRGALEELENFTMTGSESEYGLMVETVNGISAIYDTDGAYWSFYVNEEYCNYGIDEQPINDGDAFKIVYTPAE